MLVLWAREPGVELRLHIPQGENSQLRYPSGMSATVHGNRISPSHISALPTNLDVASVNLWLQGTVELVFSLLFRLIAFYFNCDSSLVLGGGECTAILDPP